MIENKPGWYFGYGKSKLHYFFKNKSLCGKYFFGDLSKSNHRYVHEKENFDPNDNRACGICRFRLNTYNDLSNMLKHTN